MLCCLLFCLCVVCVVCCFFVFFLMIRRPPRSTQSRSSAASDVYKRQLVDNSEWLLKLNYLDFLRTVCNACHLFQTNWAAVFACDDDFGEIFRTFHAGINLHTALLCQ